ncbi:MAG: chromate transporter [Porphyromonadaceae bacterium]|nr:chromate transporter [Porphyromonadaceae bacterium]
MGLNRELFGIFFKIGIGTIGGGYAMIPMMERELVDRKGWISREEFMDIMAVAQTAPGVFAVNMSSHIGHKLGGLTSGIVATVGNILPSFLIILALAFGFRHFQGNVWVEYAFRAIRPVVVALIAAPVFTMARSAKLDRYTWWIPIASAGLIYLLGISPIYIILFAGLLGLTYGSLIAHRNRTNK